MNTKSTVAQYAHKEMQYIKIIQISDGKEVRDLLTQEDHTSESRLYDSIGWCYLLGLAYFAKTILSYRRPQFVEKKVKIQLCNEINKQYYKFQ